MKGQFFLLVHFTYSLSAKRENVVKQQIQTNFK